MLFGVSDIIITDSGKQFTSNFIAVLCASIETMLETATEYHSQRNTQVSRSNRTFVPKLRFYINERRQNRDVFVQTLTYDYNKQVHTTTRASPSSLMLSREPPGSLTIPRTKTAMDDYSTMLSPKMKTEVMKRLQQLLHGAVEKSRGARWVYKKNYNQCLANLGIRGE